MAGNKRKDEYVLGLQSIVPRKSPGRVASAQNRKPAEVKIADDKKVRAALDKVRIRDRELLKRLAR